VDWLLASESPRDGFLRDRARMTPTTRDAPRTVGLLDDHTHRFTASTVSVGPVLNVQNRLIRPQSCFEFLRRKPRPAAVVDNDRVETDQ
jgi:hypothetical protein